MSPITNYIIKLGFLFSYIYPSSISSIVQKAFFVFYTGWKKKEFAQFEGFIDGFIKVVGGKNIRIGKKTTIEKGVEFQAITEANGKHFSPVITIGENCLLHHDIQLSSTKGIFIGNNVGIAARTLIVDTTHGDFNPRSFTFENGSDIPDVFLKNVFTRDYVSKGPIRIEDDVHIGMNCVIMPGVTIGHNSVVSACTVVNKNIPPYSLVSGNPCQVISFS